MKEGRVTITCTLKYNGTSLAAWVRFLITLAEGEFLVEELMTLCRKNRVRGPGLQVNLQKSLLIFLQLTQESNHDEIKRRAMTFYTS